MRLGGGFVHVKRTWHGLNFLLKPKEEAPRLSYRLAQMCDMLGLESHQSQTSKVETGSSLQHGWLDPP